MQFFPDYEKLDVDIFENIGSLFVDSAVKFGERTAYSFRRSSKENLQNKTYQEVYNDVMALGTAILNLGFKQEKSSNDLGLSFAVSGENSYEWVVTYFTIVYGLGLCVPLDKQLPPLEVLNLLKRSESKIYFFTPAMIEHACSAAEDPELSGIEYFVCLDTLLSENKRVSFPEDKRFLLYSDLLKKGYDLLRNNNSFYPLVRPLSSDPALLLFTSGTTSNSKAVILTHSNICSNIAQISQAIEIYPHDRLLSVLPLHHTLENTCGFLYPFSKGCNVFFLDSLRYLANNLKDWRITIIIGVPLLFENIYKRINDGLDKSGKKMFVNVLRPLTRTLSGVGLNYNRIIFKSVLNAFGGDIRTMISGASAINPDIVRCFKDFGIDFRQGYGMTETSPVITLCDSEYSSIGSVGRPLAGIELAIDTEENYKGAVGEILTRSPAVMKAYFRNDEANAEVFTEDGWLRTGDLGFIDNNNCLHISGRCKNMIVLNNGKKVFPEECEELLNKIDIVSSSFVFAYDELDDGDVSLACVLKLDEEASINFLLKNIINKENDINSKTIKDVLSSNNFLPSEYQTLISVYLNKCIHEVSAQMPAFKKIKYFLFTRENFIMTSSLKIKRKLQEERIASYLRANQKTLSKLSGKEMK